MTAMGILAEWMVTFLEVALCHYFMRLFFADQFRKKKQCFLYVSIAAAITTGVILLNLVSLSFSVITVLYFVVVNAVAGCVLYKGRFADFLMIAISYCAFFNLLEWSVFTAISRISASDTLLQIQTEFSVLRIVTITLTKMAEIIISLLLGRYLKKIAAKMKKTRLVALGVSAAFLSSFCLYQFSGMAADLRLNFIQTFLAAALVFGLCFTYLFYRLKLIQNEQSFTVQQNHLLQKNYEMAQASYQANAELYHDMRNHFLILQNYLAEDKIDDAKSYLEKLSGSQALQNVDRWTGIEAIDYILSQKRLNARRQHITVTVHAEYPGDCQIAPVDLCTILTNLLDNAIEACQKQPEDAEKKIEITIRRIHQFIIIRVSNTTSVQPDMRNGHLITSKSDRFHHGWGSRSVKSAVEKYQGAIEYDYQDHRFTVSVMLFYH